MHVLRLHADPALRVVDLQIAQAQGGPARGVRGQCGPFHTPQQYVDPRGQLTDGERLGHVVVRADPETDQQVGLVVPGGEHQHRDRPLGLDPAADLQSVEAGQHHVQDQQLGQPALGRGDGGRAVRGRLHLEALGPQAGRDGLGDGVVVLDDEYAPLGAGGRRGAVVGGVRLFHVPVRP